MRILHDRLSRITTEYNQLINESAYWRPQDADNVTNSRAANRALNYDETETRGLLLG